MRFMALVILSLSAGAFGAAKHGCELAPAAKKANPIKWDKRVSDKLFAENNCYGCHYSSKQLTDLHGPHTKKCSDAAIFWMISTGTKTGSEGMPSFGNLPENDRWQLVHHVRNFVKPQ